MRAAARILRTAAQRITLLFACAAGITVLVGAASATGEPQSQERYWYGECAALPFGSPGAADKGLSASLTISNDTVQLNDDVSITVHLRNYSGKTVQWGLGRPRYQIVGARADTGAPLTSLFVPGEQVDPRAFGFIPNGGAYEFHGALARQLEIAEPGKYVISARVTGQMRDITWNRDLCPNFLMLTSNTMTLTVAP